MIDYTKRLQSVQAAMAKAGIDLLFLNVSGNLTYLTGIERDEPNYGNTMYPGEWLTGAWLPQTRRAHPHPAAHDGRIPYGRRLRL